MDGDPPASHVAGVTGEHHYTQLWLRQGLVNFPAPGWPQTTIHPIISSLVAEITGVSLPDLSWYIFKPR
jgi:hypothetical protein